MTTTTTYNIRQAEMHAARARRLDASADRATREGRHEAALFFRTCARASRASARRYEARG